jgi:hypothetical protein
MRPLSWTEPGCCVGPAEELVDPREDEAVAKQRFDALRFVSGELQDAKPKQDDGERA